MILSKIKCPIVSLWSSMAVSWVLPFTYNKSTMLFSIKTHIFIQLFKNKLINKYWVSNTTVKNQHAMVSKIYDLVNQPPPLPFFPCSWGSNCHLELQAKYVPTCLSESINSMYNGDSTGFHPIPSEGPPTKCHYGPGHQGIHSNCYSNCHIIPRSPL